MTSIGQGEGTAPDVAVPRDRSLKDLPPVVGLIEHHIGSGSTSESSSGVGPPAQHARDAAATTALMREESSNPVPSIHKKRLKGRPKGILKPAPPPAKAFSFRRDVLQQLNTRLAQQGVNVQVPVPQGTSTFGNLTGTAQGTAQAAGSMIGEMFKKMSVFATAPSQDFGELPHSAEVRAPGSSSSGNKGPGQRAPSSHSDNKETSELAALTATKTNNLPSPSSSVRPLRKVRFTVTKMAVTYPISNAIAPGDEDATRLRIEREHREALKSTISKEWSSAELEKLYRDCCRMREEHPLKKMRSVFLEANQQVPPALRVLDLSSTLLDRQAIEPVADLLSVDFGLKKLVLEDCGLTDDGLKSILHALLVSGTLPNLSLASNKKIKYHGWRYVGIFMRRAKSLRYLDLSENNINKASLEHIAGAIASRDINRSDTSESVVKCAGCDEDEQDEPLVPQAKLLMEESGDVSSLTSLRLENCGLRSGALEMLARSVRFSQLNHLSLRRNKIGQMGAVALAIMIKDYPDSTQAGLTADDRMGTAEDERDTLQPFRNARHSYPTRRSLSPQMGTVVSSPGGGVTRRSIPSMPSAAATGMTTSPLHSSSMELDRSISEFEKEQIEHLRQEGRRSEEEAMSLFQAKRAVKLLSALPRVGNLLTLDLKGNDIRGGVAYLGQVVKKNRTLKVLNLSDNNIEMSGLIALADALKYNGTLETLDLSHNPCCGPGLEGITTLRTAFTLNSNLKRLFISDTDLSSEGAIALAEFLPEAKSLIHLDLTENLLIDIAGVMALAVSVRMNKSLRCLDINIPPNAPDFARLSQEILNSCIRNTEIAQRKAQQRGVKAPVAAPIYKSTLARAAKEKEERARLMEANIRLDQAAQADAAAIEAKENQEKVVVAAHECRLVLQELLTREEEKRGELTKERNSRNHLHLQSELAADLLTQGKFLRDKLQRVLGVMQDGEKLSHALQVNEELEDIIGKLERLFALPLLGLEGDTDAGQSITAMPAASTLSADNDRLQAPDVNLSGLSSPTFSIGSESDEDDDEGISTVETASSGLGISAAGDKSIGVEGPRAARDVPVEKEAEARVEGNQEVNDKARGQLSEEGEIFRRARSLHLAEENEEDRTEASKDSFHAPSGTRTEGETSDQVLPGRRERSESVGSGKQEEATGEELRRELLGTDIPRSSSNRQINSRENEGTDAHSEVPNKENHQED